MAAKERIRSHLRPLLSMKKYATMEELNSLVFLIYTKDVSISHKKFAIPNPKYNHRLGLWVFSSLNPNSEEARKAKTLIPVSC